MGSTPERKKGREKSLLPKEDDNRSHKQAFRNKQKIIND